MIRPERAIGMDTTSSQFYFTNRDNPYLPTQRPPPTSQCHLHRRRGAATGVQRPITRTPRSAQPFSVLVRLRPGPPNQAAAPALVRHATRVTDGVAISTLRLLNAATDRTIALEVARVGKVVQSDQQVQAVGRVAATAGHRGRA